MTHNIILALAGHDVRQAIEGQIFGEWSDLDHLLAKLWESHSIRPKVICSTPEMRDPVESLLPEITKRGIIDLI